MEKRKLLVGKDLLVLALLLLAAAGLCFLPREASARAVLTVDGETAAVRELEKLEKPERMTVAAYGGIELLVEFSPQGARILSSTCPDKTCARAGALTRAGDAAVCLPGRAVLKIDDKKAPAADAETF